MIRVYQAELTAECDLKCSYCPHPTMKRQKGHMTRETLARVLEVGSFPDNVLNLQHFGEPLLHPDLLAMVRMVRDAGVLPSLSTNAREIVHEGRWDVPQALADAGLHRVLVSTHILNERAWRRVVGAFMTAGVQVDGRFYPMTEDNRHDWAGQAKAAGTAWQDRAQLPCAFLQHRMFSVLWDGTITTCCVDAEGAHRLGSVFDLELPTSNPTIDLCEKCVIRVPCSGSWPKENL